ncbi:MAG: tetratricopeptide repeat protein, partial [Chloroflexi bacterium]
ARALWQVGDYEASLAEYSHLIGSSALLEAVIADLEQAVQQQPQSSHVHLTLGDAYMKDGQLQKALAAYRQALLVV